MVLVYLNKYLDNGTVNFGTHNVGSTTEETYTTSNDGNADLIIGNYSITGTDASDFTITQKRTFLIQQLIV